MLEHPMVWNHGVKPACAKYIVFSFADATGHIAYSDVWYCAGRIDPKMISFCKPIHTLK